jgi:hypothetical protein
LCEQVSGQDLFEAWPNNGAGQDRQPGLSDLSKRPKSNGGTTENFIKFHLRDESDGDHNLDEMQNKNKNYFDVFVNKAVTNFASLEVGSQFDEYLGDDEC